MMPMELKTEKGLKYFNYGFMLYIVALAIMLLFLIAFFGVIAEIIENPERFEDEQEVEEIMGPLLGMVGGLCLGLLFMLIALILFLVGLISIHGGRMEFGEPHSSSVQKGLLLIILSVVIGFFSSFAGSIASSGVGIVTSIMMALGLIYLIVEISDEDGKRMLWIAGILYIIISIISAVVTIWLYTTSGLFDIAAGDQATEENMANFMAVAMIPMAIGSLILIPILIFLLAYRRTYLRVRNKEILPVLPMYPQPYPGMYPPGYPPYYPPGQPYYPPGPGIPPAQPPGEIGIKPPQEGMVQPTVAQKPIPHEITACIHCGVNIPKGAPTCPVCGKEQKT